MSIAFAQGYELEKYKQTCSFLKADVQTFSLLSEVAAFARWARHCGLLNIGILIIPLVQGISP